MHWASQLAETSLSASVLGFMGLQRKRQICYLYHNQRPEETCQNLHRKKPYYCEVCNKAFRYSSNWRTQNDQKPKDKKKPKETFMGDQHGCPNKAKLSLHKNH